MAADALITHRRRIPGSRSGAEQRGARPLRGMRALRRGAAVRARRTGFSTMSRQPGR